MSSRTGIIRKRWKDKIKSGGVILCGICGLQITSSGKLDGVRLGKVSVDHVIPKFHGGGTNLANLQPAHSSCNYKKGSKIPEEILDNYPDAKKDLVSHFGEKVKL